MAKARARADTPALVQGPNGGWYPVGAAEAGGGGYAPGEYAAAAGAPWGLDYGYWPGPGAGYGGPQQPAGDLRGWWDQFTQGKTPDQNFLVNNRAEIEAAGWQLERPNAAGVVSKLINPQTGEIVRVLNNADNPGAGVGFNWVPQSGGGGQGGGGFGDYTAPFTEAFNYAEFTPPPDFVAPTDITEQNDPGYQNRLKLGQQALERAASAKGTLLTGGTAKDLTDYAQNFASNEYQNVYARKWGEYLQNYQQQAGEWETGYNKALGEYKQRYGIFQDNQGNAYNRLMGVAQLGLAGTNAGAQAGQGYANNYANILGNYGTNQSNLITGAGNATAAGQAGAGSAWGNAWGNVGNQVGQSLYGYQFLNNPNVWGKRT